MNILCTGGAGFIGSHLCERLSKKHNVISIDNYFTGSINNHVSNVYYLKLNTSDIFNFIFPFKPDIVFHLGEYSRVEQSFDDFETVWDFNINGTKAVLDFCLYNKCKLIYAGSSTKYANKSDGYVQSPYAWTKANNTELVKKYGEWFGLDYAITYFYNVYGPREIESGKYATLIAKYINLMRQGEPLPVVLPGDQTRNFTHINDIIDALELIGYYGKGDEYGIGSRTKYTIKEVAELFTDNIVYLPERKGNRLSAEVITEKTEQLGWESKIELKDYIQNLGF